MDMTGELHKKRKHNLGHMEKTELAMRPLFLLRIDVHWRIYAYIRKYMRECIVFAHLAQPHGHWPTLVRTHTEKTYK